MILAYLPCVARLLSLVAVARSPTRNATLAATMTMQTVFTELTDDERQLIIEALHLTANAHWPNNDALVTTAERIERAEHVFVVTDRDNQ